MGLFLFIKSPLFFYFTLSRTFFMLILFLFLQSHFFFYITLSRTLLPIILSCSFLCSAVLGFLCKDGNLFLISAIKSLGNFIINLFFFQQNRIDFFFCTILKHNVIEKNKTK